MDQMKLDQDPSKICIAIDLQQTLPCPRLTVGEAFYKRKLWVYNFSVVNLKTNQTTMFVWNEAIAARGSSEIGSCVLKWLDMNLGQEYEPSTITLTIFADNCGGQNKNIQMVLMSLKEIHSRRLYRVEFSFLVSGHSYLPCDAAFGHVELEVRKRNIIQTPNEYMEAITACVTPPYSVVQMERDDFKDLSVLLTHVTRRKTTQSAFSKSAQIIVSSHYKEGYLLKDSYGLTDNDAVKVRLMPGRAQYSPRDFNLASYNLPTKYTPARLLQREKIRDLGYLMQHYITSAANRTWWEEMLREQQDLLDNPVEVRVEEEEILDDPDNINLDYD